MIDQAIAKINAEMQKEPSDRYLEIIGHYLIDRCDEALAAKIEGGKTLKGAMEAVVKNAKQVQEHGYTPHIRPRGEEKKELEHNPEFHARRWVVEVTHSFLNRFSS